MLQEPTFPTHNGRSGGVQQILNLLIYRFIRLSSKIIRDPMTLLPPKQLPRLRHLLEFASLFFG